MRAMWCRGCVRCAQLDGVSYLLQHGTTMLLRTTRHADHTAIRGAMSALQGGKGGEYSTGRGMLSHRRARLQHTLAIGLHLLAVPTMFVTKRLQGVLRGHDHQQALPAPTDGMQLLFTARLRTL